MFLVLPSFLVAFVVVAAAKADIVVGAHSARYGSLLVLGTPNKNVQPDGTFDLTETTVGSRTEDRGDATGKPLNQKVRLLVGEYRLIFSGTWLDIEVREGQTTTIKLQKMIAAPMDQTDSVTLRVPHTPDDNDTSCWTTVATWQHSATVSEKTGQQTCSNYTSQSGPFGFVQTTQQSCQPEYKDVNVVQSWKSAYFLVLPGTYSMEWSFLDGTDHEEDGIVVK